MRPIDKMVLAVVRCTLCGAGYGECDCWEPCSCGWTARKGQPCNNPNTTGCSTKMKYGGKKKAVRKRRSRAQR